MKQRFQIRTSSFLLCFEVFILSSVVLLMLYINMNLAPFGSKTLACMDAGIQYLDFFAYFKDVLEGKNTISYTFGKTLGGSNIAVFSYYLASPLNLLVMFFSKEHLNTFFNLLVALKLSIAGGTFSYYLQARFKNNLQKHYVILLSLGYSLSQYCLAQSSNIMWLDGVYLLPLILLGVYRIVNEQSGVLLSISVGLSILFNWYTGGINCLFSIFWFFFELLFNWSNSGTKLEKKKRVTNSILHYGFMMAIGVGISAVLFLPTIVSLQGGRGTLEWGVLRSRLNGNPVTLIQNFTLGAISTSSGVSLFCGSLALIGSMSFFFCKKYTNYKK